jgi:CHAT domain
LPTPREKLRLPGRYIWPSKPRILFAWAKQLPSLDVPHEEHLSVLESIVLPLAKPEKSGSFKPELSELLTELPNASIESLKRKISEAIDEKKPYTHVHILAHGGEKNVFGVTEFRILLCEDGEVAKLKKIDGKTLSEALVPANQPGVPTVVSLSVCDSGHLGNTILPSGSLVYQLHNSGIPCVFASQFPLTKAGSVKLTKELFYELINACDPRIALYKARIALKQEQHHDWASLVAYARFPEEINQQIQDAQLKMAFALMQSTNSWVDLFLKTGNPVFPVQAGIAFQDLKPRIDRSIEQLEGFLTEDKAKSTLLTRELRAEHLGLLGSAYKRKAEYLFRLVDFYPEKKDDLYHQSREALKFAMEFYKSGFDANADSHWNAMQYLSLKASLTGSIKKEFAIWTIIEFMAGKDAEILKGNPNQLWAWGTLAELFLVKPLLAQDEAFNTERVESINRAKEYIDKIKVPGSEGVIDSTVRQIDRYISWWPVIYPETFRSELKEMAKELKTYLLLPAEIITANPG